MSAGLCSAAQNRGVSAKRVSAVIEVFPQRRFNRVTPQSFPTPPPKILTETCPGFWKTIAMDESRIRIRVLVADDHKIVREGLVSILTEQPDIEVVGEAGNGREAVDMTARLKPDVAIMDVSMPLMNGDEATRQIKLLNPETRIVALSMFEETDMVQKMFRAGAESYVLKTAPSGTLLSAIRDKKQAL